MAATKTVFLLFIIDYTVYTWTLILSIINLCREIVLREWAKIVTFHCIAVCLCFNICACSTVHRNALPENESENALVLDSRNIRYWAGKHNKAFENDIVNAIERLKKTKYKQKNSDEYTILALSGGGANGAFGVGFLRGWADRGDRPDFDIVTGVSTGALIAPFAFLGGDFENIIIDAYQSMTDEQIFIRKSFISIILGIIGGTDSLTETKPLHTLIHRLVTDKVIKTIAEEHQKGRRLYIGTTNLDARKMTIWDMGAIASHPSSLSNDLFRQVMLASASVPVAFPPVYIPVTVNGKKYDEMHVDGGVTAGVFLYGFILDINKARKRLNIGGERNAKLYIIRHNQFDVEYEQVKPEILSIAKRAIRNLTNAQGFGDLYRLYTISQRDEIDFNYVSIPAGVNLEGDEIFDSDIAIPLYQLGYKMGYSGKSWSKEPPSLAE